MAPTVVLQWSASPLLEVLLASKTLKPHLLGRIGPDAILVHSAGVKQVKATLQWAGIRVSETVTAINKSPTHQGDSFP